MRPQTATQAWDYSPLCPLPPWRDAATLCALFARLSPQQQWSMDRLVAQDGCAEGVPRLSTYALLERGLIVQVVNVDTQAWRRCPRSRHGWDLHYWFHIPAEVAEAYAAWSAQWEQPSEDVAAR